ncbi:hypothetical protein DICVIV_08062 [Dictyocaulus viviparus]|uniref:Secreted protein n=1 Tax=Dictyocaulus viviparus TaxID=29172 RepID=A0A0D8XQ79_DICVI|nr:hypothetical protein DICVIV_08062 [Dictyocaulus viviparus]
MYCPTVLMVVMIAVAVSEAAQRCYTGSKDKYESRLCDTGVAGKYKKREDHTEDQNTIACQTIEASDSLPYRVISLDKLGNRPTFFEN